MATSQNRDQLMQACEPVFVPYLAYSFRSRRFGRIRLELVCAKVQAAIWTMLNEGRLSHELGMETT